LLPNNGYTSGEWVNITGASPATYDGLYQITGVTTNTFTYTMSSTPTAPSSGTILANIVTLVQTVIPGTYLAPFGGNMDLTAPATPADLCAAVTGSNNQITLTWSPVLDPTSGVDHYAIYRDGVSYATSNAATITDSTGISPQTPHSYQVAAVNYDGLQSALSSAVSISAVGIASISTVSTTSILVAFTEPVDSVSAQVPGNYQIDGGAITVTSAVLQSDNCTVLLTTSALGAASHTLSISNVETRTLLALPTLTATFTPLAFTNQDIGSPGIAGSTLQGPVGTYTVTGGGSDIWGDPCQFQFAYVQMTGNFTVTANVNFTNYSSDGWAKAGLMARQSLSASGSSWVMACETNANGVQAQWNSAGTLGNVPVTDPSGNHQAQVQIQRVGDTYTMSEAAIGSNTWTVIIAQTIVMGSSIYVGMAVTAHNNSLTAQAVFSNLQGFAASGSGTGFVAPPFTVAVTRLTTNDPTPAISGTASDPSVSLAVRIGGNVSGNWYPVANNNGAWTLPEGEIFPALTNGIYDVLVRGTNSAGAVAYDSTLNELIIDASPPTVTMPSLALRNTPLNSLSFAFSEPVSGFSVQNLQLTLNGISLPLDGATLTTSDNQNWTLGNLSSLTGAPGTYNLTVSAAGWGVVDAGGNTLSTNTSDAWIMALAVTAANWTNGGLTLTLESDGLLHVVHTDTGLDAVPPQSPANVTAVAVTGRDNAADALTIDFSHGNPIPSGGVTFEGGAGGNADSLSILDAGGSVVLSAGQLTVSPSSVISYHDVQALSFALGAGTLDLGGNTQTSPAITLVSGQVTHGTLSSNAFVMQSGTVAASLTGSGALTKTGAGTVTLSGSNNFLGGTTVAGGTLSVSISAALPPAGAVTLAGGNLVLNFAAGGGTVTLASVASPAVAAAAAQDVTPADSPLTSTIHTVAASCVANSSPVAAGEVAAPAATAAATTAIGQRVPQLARTAGDWSIFRPKDTVLRTDDGRKHGPVPFPAASLPLTARAPQTTLLRGAATAAGSDILQVSAGDDTAQAHDAALRAAEPPSSSWSADRWAHFAGLRHGRKGAKNAAAIEKAVDAVLTQIRQ
jgi:autotransporter-associated beta strand protein